MCAILPLMQACHDLPDAYTASLRTRDSCLFQAVTILGSQLESARLQHSSVMREKETELKEATEQLQASTEAIKEREAALVRAQDEHSKRTQEVEAELAAAKNHVSAHSALMLGYGNIGDLMTEISSKPGDQRGTQAACALEITGQAATRACQANEGIAVLKLRGNRL